MRLTPSLTDPQVAVLARQAVDLLSPDITIRLVPSDETTIFRSRGTRSWTVRLSAEGVPAFAIRVDASMSPAEALAHFLAELSVYRSGSGRFEDVAFPPCPGHSHDARVTVADGEVVLRCPSTDNVADRIRPAL